MLKYYKVIRKNLIHTPTNRWIATHVPWSFNSQVNSINIYFDMFICLFKLSNAYLQIKKLAIFNPYSVYYVNIFFSNVAAK